MRRFLLFLLDCKFVFAACFVSAAEFRLKIKTRYSLQLQGFVWNHSTLNALVVTADNESWWNPSYLNTSLRAIGQWNDAITAFASNYSDYSYLSNLKIQPTVSTFRYQVLTSTSIGLNLRLATPLTKLVYHKFFPILKAL